VNEDRKPDIQQLGGQDPIADVVEVNRKDPDRIRSLPESSSTNQVNDVTRDRPPSAVGHSAGAVANNGAQSKSSEVHPTEEIGTGTGPTRAVRNPVTIGQALARLSVDPGHAKTDQSRGHVPRLDDTSEETKPKINAVAGPSSMTEPRLPTHIEDSDADDQENLGKEKRDMLWEIEMHQASRTIFPTTPADSFQKAIERLQRGIKDKGKGKKRAKLERGASVKVEEGQRNVRAGGDEPIDLSIDSD
jgi:hypothetical protein